MPFFLFDLDKATTGGEGEGHARDFLKETFFTSFDQQQKKKNKQVGASAMLKNKVEANLLSVMNENKDVVEYLKTLSPSGVELEIMSLSNFDLDNAESTPTTKVSLKETHF